MWQQIAKHILHNRVAYLIGLLIFNIVAIFFAAKVKIGYDFTRAIPTDNIKYKEFQQFKQTFGDDGGTLVIGIESKNFFTPTVLNAVALLHKQLKETPNVTSVLSITETVNLLNNDTAKQFKPVPIFHTPYTNQAVIDSDKQVFENLLFYNKLLYNKNTHSYLMALGVNKDSINSKARTRLINSILVPIKNFEKQTGITTKISGLPYLRTIIGDRLKVEMNYLLLASFLLSAFTLFIFFRSISATIMSLVVVGMGVISSMATMVLFGYNITLLTALIPPLIVVIGVPNCIYFLNKYHTAFLETKNKQTALVTMISKMGIVTLFCNIAAAIGFAVFAFTKSDLLKEFGMVSGINIMLLFGISLIFIPITLSYLPEPTKNETTYLRNKFLEILLQKVEHIVFKKSAWVYGVTLIVTAFAVVGLFKLKEEGFIVDDLPKTDKIYTDLKWFEQNFEGVMPLEIIVDTKKKKGLLRNTKTIEKIDEFSTFIEEQPELAKPLSFVEGLKFAKQAYFDGDSNSYNIPSAADLAFLGEYITTKKDSSVNQQQKNSALQLMNKFIDSNKQVARISVNMKDVGSYLLPSVLEKLQTQANNIFDSSSYQISFTGTSVTFLEGSTFIIRGLKESIFWAFLLIILCMAYLFKSVRIVLCSLIPNIIPLIVTAGVMGWAGITLKPSTVLVFSVALGIAIDITIRFLINYKQELPTYNNQKDATLKSTIHHTGISIIYTSLVLIAGFIIFFASSFGGTKSLGWLTSLTLIVGTITNLLLLPVLLRHLIRK